MKITAELMELDCKADMTLHLVHVYDLRNFLMYKSCNLQGGASTDLMWFVQHILQMPSQIKICRIWLLFQQFVLGLQQC